jgi:hypothetical protein
MTADNELSEQTNSIPVSEENEAEVLMVTFDDETAAREAVRVLNKALRNSDRTIYQGALISRMEDNELRIRDLRDLGLTDVIKGTFDLTFETGRTGLKLSWAVVSTGIGVVIGTARLAKDALSGVMSLVSSVLSMPSRRHLDRYDASEQIQETSETVEPGTTTLVILGTPETVKDLATDLARSGGRIS